MTLTLEVKDEFLPKLTELLSQFSTNVKIKDENLEYDPYFYERRKELEDIITHSNTISFEEFEQNFNKRFNNAD